MVYEREVAESAHVALLNDAILNLSGPSVFEFIDPDRGEVLIQRVGMALSSRMAVVCKKPRRLVNPIDAGGWVRFPIARSRFKAVAQPLCFRSYFR